MTTAVHLFSQGPQLTRYIANGRALEAQQGRHLARRLQIGD